MLSPYTSSWKRAESPNIRASPILKRAGPNIFFKKINEQNIQAIGAVSFFSNPMLWLRHFCCWGVPFCEGDDGWTVLVGLKNGV